MKLSPESIKLLQTVDGVDAAQLEALLQRVASRVYGNKDEIGQFLLMCVCFMFKKEKLIECVKPCSLKWCVVQIH